MRKYLKRVINETNIYKYLQNVINETNIYKYLQKVINETTRWNFTESVMLYRPRPVSDNLQVIITMTNIRA